MIQTNPLYSAKAQVGHFELGAIEGEVLTRYSSLYRAFVDFLIFNTI